MIKFIERIDHPVLLLLFIVFVVFEFWYMILREPKMKETKDKEANWIYDNGEVLLVDTNDNTKTKPFNSIDEKPINGVPNGAVIHEEDTDDLYLFDAEEKLWIRFVL